jgi:hypothetical protein
MIKDDEEIRRLLDEWVISGANLKESFSVWLRGRDER